jgi:hypothetical protein
MAAMDIDHIISELSINEKVSLLSGRPCLGVLDFSTRLL